MAITDFGYSLSILGYSLTRIVYPNRVRRQWLLYPLYKVYILQPSGKGQMKARNGQTKVGKGRERADDVIHAVDCMTTSALAIIIYITCEYFNKLCTAAFTFSPFSALALTISHCTSAPP
jgi:hypothetical protein